MRRHEKKVAWIYTRGPIMSSLVGRSGCLGGFRFAQLAQIERGLSKQFLQTRAPQREQVELRNTGRPQIMHLTTKLPKLPRAIERIP